VMSVKKLSKTHPRAI